MQATTHHTRGSGHETAYGPTGPTEGAGRFREVKGRCRDEAVSDDIRTYALLQHGVGFLGALDVSGVLVAIVTFVLWKIRAQDSPFLDDHGREATNFQVSLLIYSVALVVISIPLTVVTLGAWVFVAAVLGIGIFVLRLVGVIRAMIFTGQRCYYRYPMCLRLFG